jgi:hypothetical protein
MIVFEILMGIGGIVAAAIFYVAGFYTARKMYVK